ncbi:unnamed protein product [Ceratitis capitata]|uniref:(Mediterranean fruit fly) hypothetical protein n=1 Tax=Ceratitis capitata TaxID=7213 RepID=A0A811U606_CERCA|nr:unnamed protein product [Ceratitis capitata]
MLRHGTGDNLTSTPLHSNNANHKHNACFLTRPAPLTFPFSLVSLSRYTACFRTIHLLLASTTTSTQFFFSLFAQLITHTNDDNDFIIISIIIVLRKRHEKRVNKISYKQKKTKTCESAVTTNSLIC